MLHQEGDYLSTDLQRRHVRIQVDAIEALEVQCNVALEDLVDGARGCHEWSPSRRTSQRYRRSYRRRPEATRRSEAGLISTTGRDFHRATARAQPWHPGQRLSRRVGVTRRRHDL